MAREAISVEKISYGVREKYNNNVASILLRLDF